MAELGAPLTSTAYAVCVYDGTGALIVNLLAPAGGTCSGKPCWKVTSNSIQYKDKLASSNGLKSIKIKSGAAGKTLAKVQAKTANFAMPTLPLNQTSPVKVQLINNTNSSCWEAKYTAPPTTSKPGKWQDKND
jgi:hypothetical protein